MNILLDECIDRRFAKDIEGHTVTTVPQAGWAGIKNGELLTRAQTQFDVFVTVDRNLAFQQHIPRFNIAIVVLQAPTNRLKDLRPLLPKLRQLPRQRQKVKSAESVCSNKSYDISERGHSTASSLSERPSGQPGKSSASADEEWTVTAFAMLRKVESLFIVKG